eukprot:7723535-Pyramimonas_sp.AAC.1
MLRDYLPLAHALAELGADISSEEERGHGQDAPAERRAAKSRKLGAKDSEEAAARAPAEVKQEQPEEPQPEKETRKRKKREDEMNDEEKAAAEKAKKFQKKETEARKLVARSKGALSTTD